MSLRVGEREVTLSDDDKRLLSDRVRDVLSGCGLNSEDDPDHFRGESAASVWETTLSRSRLYVRFAEPFENTPWFGDKHLVSEGLIGLHARLPGPDLTRHRGETLLHIKCDGTRLLALMCAPPLRPHLTETQVKNCRFLDRQPM